MRAEEIIKTAKVKIVNKYFVSFDDVKLIEYTTWGVYNHDMVFYIDKLNRYIVALTSETSVQIGNTEEFKDELLISLYEYDSYENIKFMLNNNYGYEKEKLTLRDSIDEIIKLSTPIAQKTVAIEELSELIKELTKDLRGQENKEHIFEEVCDVILMIYQLLIIYDLNDEDIKEKIQQQISQKVERTLVRLKNEK